MSTRASRRAKEKNSEDLPAHWALEALAVVHASVLDQGGRRVQKFREVLRGRASKYGPGHLLRHGSFLRGSRHGLVNNRRDGVHCADFGNADVREGTLESPPYEGLLKKKALNKATLKAAARRSFELSPQPAPAVFFKFGYLTACCLPACGAGCAGAVGHCCSSRVRGSLSHLGI